MFFVLSGFLIAYILMKEHKKYGSIDVAGFFRGRFIRIWFVLALYCPVELIVQHTSPEYKDTYIPIGYSIQRLVSSLTFTCNIANMFTQLWSVAVEFQMYMISPWIIQSMLDSSPYRLPLILFFLSIVLKLAITYAVCPYILNNVVDVEANECFKDPAALWMNTYAQMYTRAGPYFLGMIAAYWHLNPESRPDLNPMCQTLLEYICVYILVSIGLFGAQSETIRIKSPDGTEWNSIVAWIYGSVSRSLYAAAWFWLIPFFLEKGHIPAYRPAYCCRAYLGCKGWVPLATISYSMYVWSELLIGTRNVTSGDCDYIWG